MRVFLDTNVVVSAAVTTGLCHDLLRLVVNSHELVVSTELLVEVERVLRDELNGPPAAIASVLGTLREAGEAVPAMPLAEVALKDPADVAIVSAAVNGGAAVLVTGDKEVLALGRVGRLDILSARQFWERLHGLPPSR